MSTNPGVTNNPSASSSCRPRPSTRPTWVTMPSVMATSAVRAAAPVPSTTRPARMTRSSTGRGYCVGGDKALLAFAREEEGAVAREVLAVEQVDLTAEVLESSLDLRAAGVGVVHDEGVVRIDGPVVIERCPAR